MFIRLCKPWLLSNIRTFSSPRRKHYKHEQLLPVSPPDTPPAPGHYQSAVSIDLLVWDISYKWNHVICYPCDWILSLSMFSKFIYIIACINPLFLFMAEWSFIEQIYHIWVVSTFWLLWAVLLWTFVYKILGKYTEVKFLVYTVTLFKILRNCQTVS